MLDEKDVLRHTELSVLQVFCDFCDKKQIQYYLAAGTLLGAIRHQGFIPWDDDVDVVMPRADYDRFLSLARKELSGEYICWDEKYAPDMPLYFCKFQKKGTYVKECDTFWFSETMSIGIDIFPLDICPDRESLARLLFRGVRVFNLALRWKNSIPGSDFRSQMRGRKLLWLVKLLSVLPVRWLVGMRNWFRISMGFGASGQKLCTIGGAHGYPRESYDATWFHTAETRCFEGVMRSCPGGWHEILQHMYGDYMTPPDEAGRKPHFAGR